MTEHSDSGSSDEEKSKKTGGGSAFGSGANFQTSLTAIVAAHILHGSPLGWLDGVCDDRPAAVWGESEGPGDDLRIELTDGSAIEVQAKKGLARGDKLWSALMELAQAIHDGSLAYGILAVASDSSATIREALANDIERLGQGRVDRLTDIGNDFHNRLLANNLSVEVVCRSLQIRVIDTLISKNGDINAAKNVLRSILENEAYAEAAFDILGFWGLRLIQNRGRWTLRGLVQLLRTRGIRLRDHGSPAAMLDRFAYWVCDNHKNFAILGIPNRIPIEHLLPMKLEHRQFEQEEAVDAMSALERYQKIRIRETLGSSFDSKWTARFRKLAVVVAGPGLGKSTLLRELAHQYSVDGFIVLSAPLKWIAAGMQNGRAFSDLLVTKAFDGSGLSAGEIVNDKRFNLVVLLDALDECGDEHDVIADHIRRFSSGHPEARIIVTTRPIGYTSSALSDWAHYTLLPPRAEEGAENLGRLLDLIAPGAGDVATQPAFSAGYGRRNAPSNSFATSPQLLGLSAVLIHRNRILPATRVRLYSELIKLFEEAPITARAVDGAELTDIAIQVLDMTGWHLLENPLIPLNQLLNQIGADLVPLIGKPLLVSKGYARAALSHWERAGLVETFYHRGTQLIAFIHKTFCEFVAARYLTEQSPAVIDGAVDRMGLDEVINFGVGLGLADKLLDIYLRRHATKQSGQIPKALALLSKPDVKLTSVSVERLIHESFAAIDDQHSDSFAIGLALANVQGGPEDLVRSEAVWRLYVAQPSIRLIAWSLVDHHADADINSTAILSELALTVPPFDARTIFGKHKQDRSDLELLRRLALDFLKAQPDSQARGFAEQLRNQVFESVGFLIDVNVHLTSRSIQPIPTGLDRLDSEQEPATAARLSIGFDLSGMEAFVAIAKAFVPLDHRFSLDPPRERALPQLAAFVRASGFMDMPAGDVTTWKELYDEVVVRSTLRYVASHLPLELDALQQECCEVLDLYLAGKSSLYDVLANVDIPKLSWPNIRTAPKTLGDIKQGLLHSSEWLCRLAMESCEPFSMNLEELKKILHASSGHSLVAVLYLIARNHPDDLVDLAWQRLVSTPTNDVSSILDLFRQLDILPSSPIMDIALSSLNSNCKNTVSAATKLLGAWVNKGTMLDRDRLEGAVEHWGGREAAKSLKLLHTPVHSIIELSDRVQAMSAAIEK